MLLSPGLLLELSKTVFPGIPAVLPLHPNVLWLHFFLTNSSSLFLCLVINFACFVFPLLLFPRSVNLAF